MKAAKKIRKLIGYEPNVPRCANCRHHITASIVDLKGTKAYRPAFCRQHGINVHAFACCDTWIGMRGETFDQVATCE